MAARTTYHPALPHRAFPPFFPPSQALLSSLSDLAVFLQRSTEQCVTVLSALPFYLVPAPLAPGQEVGPEQYGSQAPGAVGS